MLRKGSVQCYLCGRPIVDEMSRDHVPPRQFFPSRLRRTHNLSQLITLPTHETCNHAYKLDEDFFVHDIGPLSKGTFAGDRLWTDIRHRLGKKPEAHLREIVLAEFETRPSGLILPKGIVVKRVKPRVHRVAWKIARGLFTHDLGRFLPEHTPRRFEVINDKMPPGDHLLPLLAEKSRAAYPGVFDYKRISVSRPPFHQIAILFWDSIAWCISFHDPDCGCEKCAEAERRLSSN